MGHLFISYARDDAAFAARLREGFEAGGFSAWMDTTSMAGGEQWTKEIESAIESAAYVVVVVSHASNESEWVRREVLYAQQLGKRVVPVLAEQVRLPSLLIDRHALALHEDFDAGLNRLLNALPESSRTGAPASAERRSPARLGNALWLFVGAAVVVVFAVIAVRGEGLVAEVLATGFTLGGALLAMAWKADDAISLQFKRDLSLWLAGLDPAAVGRSVQRWPAHFAALFDRVFGNKHLSWRCFFRSSIASLVAFLLCTIVYMQAAMGEWAVFTQQFGWGGTLWVLGLIGAIANLLPDYVSLLETRWVIHRMQRTPSLAGQMGWLLVDFFVTAAIFFLFVAMFMYAVGGGGGALEFIRVLVRWSPFMSTPVDEPVGGVLEFIAALVQWSLLTPVDEPWIRVLAIPVWTTYFTTVWVWLYFVAQFLIRMAIPLRRALGFLQYALPVDQRPMRAVGQVMALVACAGYCLVMLPASSLSGSTLAMPVKPQMVIITPGEFRMGDLSGKGEPDEQPVHTVTIAKRFAIGKYEVTFEEYDRFARATRRALPDDLGWGRGKRPVINVSWEDATAYTEWLSEQTGHSYRLPTEAEWEYAARAGTETAYWWGDRIGENRANCFGCGSQWDNTQTAPAGSFDPNPWGLHDTTGNVWEWVEDCWHGSYQGGPTNGEVWEGGGDGDCALRVLRGGAWDGRPRDLRSAYRDRGSADYRSDFLGFRLAQDL